ncbi:MAG: CHASE domain-containing protein [Oligoflexales bacterium]
MSLLLHTKALFEANYARVSERQFAKFVESSGVGNRETGMLGLGFAELVPKSRLQTHIAEMQLLGVDGYKPSLSEEADEYALAIMAKPFDGTVKEFDLGYDLFSQPAQKDVMERARDSGLPQVSDNVVVGDGADEREQRVFIYVPVYWQHSSNATVADRRKNLAGFVYSPVKTSALFESALPQPSSASPRFAYEVYADRNSVPFYRSEKRLADESIAFEHEQMIAVPGRQWRMVFLSYTPTAFRLEEKIPLYIFICGLLLGTLLTRIRWMELKKNEREKQYLLGQETHAERNRLLAQAGDILASSFDYNVTLSKVANLAVPDFADWCVVWIEEEKGILRKVTATNADPTNAELTKELGQTHIYLKMGEGPYKAYIEGKPDLQTDVNDRLLLKSANSEDHFRVLQNLKIKSSLSVPFNSGGKTLGVISFLRPKERPVFTEADIDIAQALASRAAIAVENSRLHKEAQDHREFLLLVANGLPALVSYMERDRKYKFVNLTYEKWFKRPRSEMVGHHIRDVVGPTIFEAVESHLDKAFAGEEVNYEIDLNYPDGAKRTISASYVPDFDPSGVVKGVVVLAGDISERRRVEDELREEKGIVERLNEEIRHMNEDLERRVKERTHELALANKELESFSYSVSHDLRSPLRGVDGFCKFVLQEYGDKLEERGRAYLERARAAAGRMSQLIDDMLTLSRVTRKDMTYQEINLSDLVQTIADDLMATAPERDVMFVIEKNILIRADAILIRSVFENLLNNAWKFTQHHQQARIEFGLKERNGAPALYVKDDGAGFDMEFAGKLFGAFQRLHDSEEFPGTGIGLATAQRIVHRHGGRMWAEAGVEKGATFYLTLKDLNVSEVVR